MSGIRSVHHSRSSGAFPYCADHLHRLNRQNFLAYDGRDLPTVGGVLGQTQTQTTRRYMHLFDDNLRAATEGMGARLERKPKGEIINIAAVRK